jgi:hypothetical protein
MNPFLNSQSGCPSPSHFLDFQAPNVPSDEHVTFFDPEEDPLSRKINYSIEPVKFTLDQTKLKGLELFMDEIESTALQTYFLQGEDYTFRCDSTPGSPLKPNIPSHDSLSLTDLEHHHFYPQLALDQPETPQPEPPKNSSRVLRKRKLDAEYEDKIPEEAKVMVKQVKTEKLKGRQRSGMVQNYKGVTSRGWARVLVDPYDSIDSGLYQELLDMVMSEWEKEKSLRKKFPQVEDLFNEVLEYIRKEVRGKVIKKSGNNKESEDSKVGNAQKIQEVFYSQIQDSESTLIIKKILREHISYFFYSKYFFEWIFEDCRASDTNKCFLLLNSKEFQKVFSIEGYRPKFIDAEVSLEKLSNLICGIAEVGLNKCAAS